MQLNLVVTIVPATIAAIVSVAVVLLTRRSETIKHLESLKTSAYVDFIRGVAGLGLIQKEPVQSKEHFLKGWDLKLLVADSKSRIALYGGESVVNSLAEFLRGGTALDSPERAKEFMTVCRKMRADSRPRLGAVSDHDLHFLLFGVDMENYN